MSPSPLTTTNSPNPWALCFPPPMLHPLLVLLFVFILYLARLSKFSIAGIRGSEARIGLPLTRVNRSEC